jgi:ferric-chelate reductase [NAD(P)H]
MIDLTSLYKIQYGMYIVTSTYGGVKNGQVVTVVFQVTNEPIQIATCISKKTYTHDLIAKSGLFGVSILDEETPTKFIANFGYRCGRNFDKFCNTNFIIGETGCPLATDNALVTMEMKVATFLDVGSHTLFVGELKNSQKLRDGKPMTYEYYHDVRKGTSPENAPTYIKSN